MRAKQKLSTRATQQPTRVSWMTIRWWAHGKCHNKYKKQNKKVSRAQKNVSRPSCEGVQAAKDATDLIDIQFSYSFAIKKKGLATGEV
eukprot:7350781-Ditylum_brightwellii.AAC.1